MNNDKLKSYSLTLSKNFRICEYFLNNYFSKHFVQKIIVTKSKRKIPTKKNFILNFFKGNNNKTM